MRFAILAVVAVGAILGGCDSGSNQELQQWMAEEQKKTQPKVQPLPAPKKYFPQPYLQDQAVEPFNAQKMALAFRKESVQSDAASKLIASELARRKEPLEAVPLDTMVMVGSLNRGGNQIALIRIDRLLYQVEPGHYLGQNFGRVTKISETEVALREIVQDPGGEWIERAATLQLQERAK